MDELGI